jgi:hypothetical protein
MSSKALSKASRIICIVRPVTNCMDVLYDVSKMVMICMYVNKVTYDLPAIFQEWLHGRFGDPSA